MTEGSLESAQKPKTHELNQTVLAHHGAAESSEGSKKRKRDEDQQQVHRLASFVIRSCPASIYDKPYTLKPLRLLNRSRLPLSILDNAPSKSSIPTTRLFSASIDVLEASYDELSEDTMVLIASSDMDTSLYAVERVKSRVYSLCKLCSWVKIGYLEDHSAAAYTPAVQRRLTEQRDNDAEAWWRKATVQASANALEKPSKRLQLSMAPPPQLEQKPSQNEPASAATLVESTAPVSGPVPSLQEQQISTQEILEILVRQYLEALYKSKTSLAFFVKGPLSRARAACNIAVDEGLVLSDLIGHLRSMLLSMTSMDKKYREKIPGFIRSLPPGTLSDAEREGSTFTKKRKSKKPPKLSKEGFYSFEDDHCKRWWLAGDSTSEKGRQDETAEQKLRRRVGDLRVRETLAQIVLILEILALEASQGPRETEEKIGSGGTSDKKKADIASCLESKKRKGKKPLDLSLQLDLLLDKLSIWQSIEQDNVAAGREGIHDWSSRDNVDKLQDRDLLASFCIEVVIPFFKSRVPEQASLVNKKFGGPGAISPEKQKKAKVRKSGEPAPRNVEKKTRRPLQKTPSEASSQLKARPPSLARSATDSIAIPRLKREISEVSLLDVPQARPYQRDSSAQLKHLKQRQIDLTAITAATEAKLKHKAKIEEELKEAISTLKKPNRGMAVRDYVDAAEQRSLGSASMRKKTAGPVRKILQNVQVTATPRHNRSKNALLPSKSHMVQEEALPEPPAPSSGDFCIPSSAVRPSSTRSYGSKPSSSHHPPFASENSIAESPCRGAAKSTSFSAPSNEFLQLPTSSSLPSNNLPEITLAQTPSRGSTRPRSFTEFLQGKISDDAVPQTPSKRNRAEENIPAIFKTPQKPTAVFATPIKARDQIESGVLAQIPELSKSTTVSKTPGMDGGNSIYDALGWNDDFDELE